MAVRNYHPTLRKIPKKRRSQSGVLKGPIHSKLNCEVWLYKKMHQKLDWMFPGTAQVSHQVFSGFFFGQFCWVPWNNAIVVLAGKVKKLWVSLSELRSSLCERRLERTLLRPTLLPVNTVQFTQFFHQVWRHTVKSLNLTECIGRLRLKPRSRSSLPHRKLCHILSSTE